VKKFENELADLELRMTDMGNLTKSMLRLACSTLRNPGRQVQEEVADMEDRLDKMQVENDREVVRLMTVYSPVATDLRSLIVTMHLTSQLERIGDQVVNICEALALMDADSERPDMSDLNEMAKLVSAMLAGALDSYFERDIETARRTWSQDDLVDAKNDQIIKQLLSDSVLNGVLNGTEDVADALAQILLARHLERIADQSANISKEVVYMVEGHDVRHEHQT
jgi:phosphate transport system protein